ncbi:gtpase-activating protein [Stylonychia lemnae]|uniref:Gtpase-activating protein n=1 Tax=Stylonychia lemnae TaxID=5949 RepID=A0A078AKQ6_STYLE|nr:gtpase-activating protein [Stylonychia lemnae]|eukprot:CDW82794.1 gtpase-activating protein [Stylonychia lemnae]
MEAQIQSIEAAAQHQQTSLIQSKINQLKNSQSLVPFSDEDFVMIQKEINSSLNVPIPEKKQDFKAFKSRVDQIQSKISNFSSNFIKRIFPFKKQQPIQQSDQVTQGQQGERQQSQHVKLDQNGFIFIDDYQNELSKLDWIQLYKMKKFAFTQDRELYPQVKYQVFQGLSSLPSQDRQAAWLLLLGIDTKSEQYRTYQELYYDFLCTQCERGSEQEYIENLIDKDIHRTFAEQKMFTEHPKSGRNRLFNLLKAYSLYDTDVGYMQGMNFIAWLVLKNFGEDDALAFAVFARILKINEWKRLYIQDTPKLFEMIPVIKSFLMKRLPKLDQKLTENQVPLEPLLAAPFITIFANLIEIEDAERALERFMLLGENYVIDTLKNMFTVHKEILMEMDAWDLQVFIGRKMFQASIENGTFFLSHTHHK